MSDAGWDTANEGAPSSGEPRAFANGRYRVSRRLGAGNFATVFLAHDERLDVPVAIKLLADRWSWDPETRVRFVQEARLLRSINDSHVVQIRDIAETDDGRPYLVMDYANRGTLDQRLTELAQRGTSASVEDMRAVALGLSASLRVLHSRRIAHRDVKPSNLLLCSIPAGAIATGEVAVLQHDERLLLGDLGLAKDLDNASGLTAGVGTAGYMAPEQSLPGATIDTRTDIFAASALLAEVASGEPPDPLRKYHDGTLVAGSPLSETIPAALRAVLVRGLDADPARRPQTIDDWYAQVSDALPAPSADASTVEIESRAAPARGQARRVLHVAIAALAVVILGLGVAFASRDDAPATAPSSTGAVGPGVTIASTTASVTATQSTALATTAPVAPSTTPPTTRPQPSAQLIGPTTIQHGVPAYWNVQSSNAVRGTWSLTGPFPPSNPNWLPGNGFQGTWNVQTQFRLTLTVFNAEGDSSSAFIDVTVV
jgi:serine/threonine protein kinase